MSNSHSYRVQLHCDKQTFEEILMFARQRGLSKSAAARLLVDRGLNQNGDLLAARLDRLESKVESVLHASSAARVLSSELVRHERIELSKEDFSERIKVLVERYLRMAG